MPFTSRRAKLVLLADVQKELAELSRSRSAPSGQRERARILLAYAAGETVSAIARQMRTNRPKVERCIQKALDLGPKAALRDLPRAGRSKKLTAEARVWVVSLACQKPKDLGYSYELWTTALLARHVREHCQQADHPSLAKLGRGTVSKILSRAKTRPHKIQYYLERRDPLFEVKSVQVLCVYREINLLRAAKAEDTSMVAYLSYDEKPGIQAIENLAPDLPPVPGQHECLMRDHQYRRHGTVTLMAAIDLLTGHVHGQVVERHRSREFIEFLNLLDAAYAPEKKIRVILDNHSAHISKETRAHLATRPNRFEFIFTPTHGSWLNLIESFFGKMARTMLRAIRVKSKAELKERLRMYLDEINADPVVFHWKYRMEELSVA